MLEAVPTTPHERHDRDDQRIGQHDDQLAKIMDAVRDLRSKFDNLEARRAEERYHNPRPLESNVLENEKTVPTPPVSFCSMHMIFIRI